MIDFGQCFRAFLKRKKITQIEAGVQTGFSQAQISRLCNQPHRPRPHVLEHMAQRFGVAVEELLGGAATGGAHAVVLREDSPGYGADAFPVVAGRLLRTRYRGADDAERAVIEADVKRLFCKQASVVLNWLASEED